MDRWIAAVDIQELLGQVKDNSHPHLSDAKFALEFVDSKPYIDGRLNLGKASKFSKAAKLWHAKDKKYDFRITLCATVWQDILNEAQREALLDLHLSCCNVEYEPETVEVNGKPKPQKDEYGCVVYSNNVKHEDDGSPCYCCDKLDLKVLTNHVKRYGLWFSDLLEFKGAVDEVAA